MVRNVNGGSKTKSRARKDTTEESNVNSIRLPECELEKIAFVSKAFGNGRFEILLNNGNTIHCITRGKHKGKNRRNNLVVIGGLVLIGLREWENPHKTSDLITVYTSFEVDKLKTMPSINLTGFPLEDINGISYSSATDSNLIFSNTTQANTTNSNNLLLKSNLENIKTDDSDSDMDIDIDDI